MPIDLLPKVAEFLSLLRSVGDTSAAVQMELLTARVRNGQLRVHCDGDPSAVTRWFVAWVNYC